MTSKKQNNYGPEMPMVAVPRAVLGTYATKPWTEVIAAGNAGTDGLWVDRLQHGVTTKQEDRKTWEPPFDLVTREPITYLKLNHAWLREVKGLAFVYLQNW